MEWKFSHMKSWAFSWAGIIFVIASVLYGSTMISSGDSRQADALWPPILIFWVGCCFLIRGAQEGRPPRGDTWLPYLRLCYLIKALMWVVAYLVTPDWWDGYWQGLIPPAYFCGAGDMLLTVVWCTMENLVMALSCRSLIFHRSYIPFGLACLSACHALVVHNPLLLTATCYLLARTGSWNFPRLEQEQEGPDIGFSPEAS